MLNNEHLHANVMYICRQLNSSLVTMSELFPLRDMSVGDTAYQCHYCYTLMQDSQVVGQVRKKAGKDKIDPQASDILLSRIFTIFQLIILSAMQGCWSPGDGCQEGCNLRPLITSQNLPESVTESLSSLRFCCCHGSYCNANITEDFKDQTETTSNKAGIYQDDFSFMKLFLYSTIGLLVLVITIVLIIQMRKKNSHSLRNQMFTTDSDKVYLISFFE